MRKTPSTVVASIPPKTAEPSALLLAEPAPAEITSGKTPKTNDNAVIRIGLNRRRLAVSAASIMLAPSLSCVSFANSTSRIAVLDERAISRTIAICVYTLLSYARAKVRTTAPNRATGITSIIETGISQDSY